MNKLLALKKENAYSPVYGKYGDNAVITAKINDSYEKIRKEKIPIL